MATAIPASVTLVEIRAQYIDFSGAAVQGKVTFTPSVSSAVEANLNIILVGSTVRGDLDVDGKLSVHIPATDDPDLNPQGFYYRVVEDFVGLAGRQFDLFIPVEAGPSGMELADEGPTPVAEGIVTILSVNGGDANDTYDTVITGGGAAS